MAPRPFLFEAYRVNIVDEPDLFNFNQPTIRSDDDIGRILEKSTESRFDFTTETPRDTLRWSLREFVKYEFAEQESPVPVLGLTLARSVTSHLGQTVTDDSIEEALSEPSPPTAETIHLLFFMRRHLAAVEYNSVVMVNQTWRRAFQAITKSAAIALEYVPGLHLEPVPREEEVMRAFRSFRLLTRLRVRLRIPNPELDRRTERLRKDMVDGAIREYTQDMKNPRGLSQDDGALPHAAAAMAQAGYKDGEVLMEGYREGDVNRSAVRTGSQASRGRIDGLKDFVRGMKANAKSKETKVALTSILKELNRVVELPPAPDVDEQAE